jgi:hypothetical protein
MPSILLKQLAILLSIAAINPAQAKPLFCAFDRDKILANNEMIRTRMEQAGEGFVPDWKTWCLEMHDRLLMLRNNEFFFMACFPIDPHLGMMINQYRMDVEITRHRITGLCLGLEYGSSP